MLFQCSSPIKKFDAFLYAIFKILENLRLLSMEYPHGITWNVLTCNTFTRNTSTLNILTWLQSLYYTVTLIPSLRIRTIDSDDRQRYAARWHIVVVDVHVPYGLPFDVRPLVVETSRDFRISNATRQSYGWKSRADGLAFHWLPTGFLWFSLALTSLHQRPLGSIGFLWFSQAFTSFHYPPPASTIPSPASTDT